jgi:hypothetical protein
MSTQPEPVGAETMDWWTRIVRHFEITTLLRIFGGGLTVMAIMMFLFQRWDEATDLLRYGMIMGETLILTGLGLATSFWMKEQKSARLFLGLSLVSTSATFTILGAMIYSQVQWLAVDVNPPEFAFWMVESMDSLAWLLPGSLLLLGGQSLFGFSVLARPVAKSLTLILLLNVSLLLLPIREMGITALIVAPALLFVFRYLSLLRRSTPAMRTGEGLMASALVMLPLFIMVGRGAYLYAGDAMAFGSLALIVYLLLRQLALSLTVMIRFRQSLEIASLLPAVVVALSFTQVVEGTTSWAGQGLVMVFGLLLSTFLLDLAKRAVVGAEHYFHAIFYTGLAVAAIEIILWPGSITALFSTVLSGTILLYGYNTKQNNLLRLSVLTTLASFVLLISELFDSYDLGIWISLALIGMSVIVLAAAVERYNHRIQVLVQRLKP